MSSQPHLEPGDSVVPLAALATKSSAFAGSITLGQLAYRADASGLSVLLCILLGFVVGAALGFLIGRLAFPAASGHVVVVKAGRSALVKTLPAALVPAYAVAAVLAAAAPMVLGGPPTFVAILVAGLSATSAGAVFGLSSALA